MACNERACDLRKVRGQTDLVSIERQGNDME